PETFNTNEANDGARHVIQPDKFLGAGVDAERDGNASAEASGDDGAMSTRSQGTVTGGDDEDGIKFITPLIPNNEACIEVTYTAVAGENYLTGWLDFDGDGAFTAAEQLMFNVSGTPTADVLLANGTAQTVTYCFNVPADATFDGGETHARFRMSCETGVESTGFVIGGEVEDYHIPLAKVGSLAWNDYNYDGIQNEPADAGVNGLVVSLTAAGVDGILGNSDDVTYETTTGLNTADEPGYYTFCGLTTGDYQLEIDAGDNISTLLNQTDEDQDADEFVQTFTVDEEADNMPLNEDGMSETSGGNGFPDSHEDLTFDFGFPGFDFGDLPDSYTTLFDNDGARHVQGSNLYLGSCVDLEIEGAPDAMAGTVTGGDNNTAGLATFGICAEAGNDEDGIRFITPLIPGEKAQIEVTSNAPNGAAILNTFIDFNGDGDFAGDADERVELYQVGGTPAFNAVIPQGTNTQIYCFDVPATATFTGGEVYSRFRLSTTGDLSYDGQAADGEVEDYWQPLAKVGNVVWQDNDYDGEQDEAATTGINGVTITLVTAGADGALGNDDDISFTTETATIDGVDGAYCFGGLTSGNYKLDVTTPTDYQTTLIENITDGQDDSDLSGVTFTIPDLINDFLPTGEDGVADTPNSYNDYPDTHDDWTFDFGFVAFDYGDLPSTFPTGESNDGPRHAIGSGYVLGSCVDAELNGQPQDNAGVINEGGDDNTSGTVTDGDCTDADDGDGIRLLTPLVPGAEACIEVKSVAPENAVLNAWIDFNGDGDFVNDSMEQLVFTTLNEQPLASPNTQGQLPAGQQTQIFCFDVPTDATFEGAETYFRYRMSQRGNLSYTGLASSGDVEDYWLPLAKVGNLIWEDTNYNGEQDEASETGINGVIVQLITPGFNGILGDDDDRVYETVTQTVDGVDGRYDFCGLQSGDYRLQAIYPDGFLPTYFDATNEETDDHDGYFVDFEIPDLINDFLYEDEDSAGDNPDGGDFPDLNNDLTFDFGFALIPVLDCLTQIGDFNGDGDNDDLNEQEVDSPGVPSEFNGNGIVEVAGCDAAIPNQFMKIDFGYDMDPINPMFEYDILINNQRIVTGVVPTADTTLAELIGNAFIYGMNEIKVEIYYNDGVTRTLNQSCDSQLEVRTIQTTITCNNSLNISLSSNCEATLNPDILLEGLCDDNFEGYEITATLINPSSEFENVLNLDLPAIINNSTNEVTLQVPGTYRYVITLGDELTCWGDLQLEDKSAPVCAPAGDEEALINYDIDCDGIIETAVNDPSGVDDLADEYILCTLLEQNGHEIYFDELEARDAAFDLDGDGIPPYNADGSVRDADDLVADCDGDGINESSVCGDFSDCTGIETVLYEDEEIDVCELADLSNLPIDATQYDVTAFEVTRVYKRTWFAIDLQGMRSTQGCSQYVFGLRPKVATIELREEVAIDCSADPALVDLLAAPYFSVQDRIVNNGTGSNGPTAFDRDNNNATSAISAAEKVYYLTPGEHTCKYATTYHEDPQIEVCSGGYKQIRHWSVVDWCDGGRVYDEFTQLVKVEDTTTPTLVLAGTETAFPAPVTAEEIALGIDTIFNTQLFDCQVDSRLPLMSISDDCSTPTIDRITIERTVQDGHNEEQVFINNFAGANGVPANGGDLATLNLPAGIYTVTYFYSDDCGNADTRSFTFQTVSERAPQAICNDQINVTLVPTGNEGDQRARVYAEDLDDTSSDACFDLIYHVRKGDGTDQPWTEYVEYDCSDIENTDLKLELRVTADANRNGVADENEQFSVCWGLVNIEDKTPPLLAIDNAELDCADNRLVQLVLATGDYTAADNDGFFPTVVGGCTADGVTLQLTDVDLRAYDPTCKIGRITRTFTAYRISDDNRTYGNEVTQNITVTFRSDWTMTFPADVMVVCDPAADSNLDNVPDPVRIEDILTNRGCDQWGMETNDEIFDIVGQDGDGACFKVIRTYKFINWCTWDPTNTEEGVVPRPLDFFTDASLRVTLDYQSDSVLDICTLQNNIDDRFERANDPYDLQFLGRDFNPNTTLFADERDADFVYFDEDDVQGGDAFFTGDCITDGFNAVFGTSIDRANNTPANELIDDAQTHNFVSAEAYGYFIYRQIIKVVDNQAPV
ncbi:MAG: SdrD B-like domain-containing protein, partial [Saprospiraceae bacterium]